MIHSKQFEKEMKTYRFKHYLMGITATVAANDLFEASAMMPTGWLLFSITK